MTEAEHKQADRVRTFTIVPWQCPECGETERTGPLVNNPGYEDGELGHCAECQDDYPAPEAITVVELAPIGAALERLAIEHENCASECEAFSDETRATLATTAAEIRSLLESLSRTSE